GDHMFGSLSPPLAQRCIQKRVSVQQQKIEKHEGDRHIRCRCRKQVSVLVLASEALLQIKERQSPAFCKSYDFAVSNQLLVEFSGLFGELRELSGNASQIARENLDPLSVAMKLGANAVEFVLNIHGSRDR